jgi:hypothetical protein
VAPDVFADEGRAPRPAVGDWFAANTVARLPSIQVTTHRVAVEACSFELAHDHPDVLLAEVLSPVTKTVITTPNWWRKRRWLVALPPSSRKP